MAAPTDATLAWVAEVAAPGGRLVDAGPLAERESPWRVRIESAIGPTTVVVRARVGGHESRRLIEIERAALEAAGKAGVAATRFVAADPDGTVASQPALRALGRAVGTLAANEAPGGLPPRPRPLEDIDVYAMWRESAAAVRARRRASDAGEPWASALQALDEHQPTAATDVPVLGGDVVGPSSTSPTGTSSPRSRRRSISASGCPTCDGSVVLISTPRRWRRDARSPFAAPSRRSERPAHLGAGDSTWPNRPGVGGVPVTMSTDRTPVRPTIPAYFLGRPSIRYVERYRRSHDRRR